MFAYDYAMSSCNKLPHACLDFLINHCYKTEKYLPTESSSWVWTASMSFNTGVAYGIAMLLMVRTSLQMFEPIDGLSQHLLRILCHWRTP
jgi:hypothetical protein